MAPVGSEAELAALAAALIGGSKGLTSAERRLLEGSAVPRLSERQLNSLRRQVARGADPLGEAFVRLRSHEVRRKAGATYTPPALVESMVAWAAREGTPTRIVDPGAGSGRFLLAAAEWFPSAALIAVESDPLAALLLRANLSARRLDTRARVLVEDYRSIVLPPHAGRTLFIGNPPYVRHHDISGAWKNWFADAAKRHGIEASKLAGLHLHFFFKTFELAKADDYGTFITSAEWLDVNYGAALRALLGDGLGGLAMHVIDPRSLPFSDAATTGVITCFRAQRRPTTFRVRAVADIADLDALSDGAALPWEAVLREKRWTNLLRSTSKPPSGHIELGELCRVHRGQVTGANDVWIAGARARNIPDRFLVPTVTKAKELIAAGDSLLDASKLRRVVDLPAELDAVPAANRHGIDEFIAWARSVGADRSYIARHRAPWWSVRLRDPAPIVCTYMARRPPVFVRNLCGARHINIAHGLYPREPLSNSSLTRLAAWLRGNVKQESGRTYARGLTKFEPKEIERIHVPRPENLPEWRSR